MHGHLFVVCRKLFKRFWDVLSVGSRERVKHFFFRVSVNKQGFWAPGHLKTFRSSENAYLWNENFYTIIPFSN